MATLPIHVEPGSIISSDLMNAILEELARLGGTSTPSGTQAVPNLLGAFLGDARAAILDPARQLAMGFTLDVAGAAINPIASANVNRIVLNQYPSAHSLVAPGTPVNLVVSRPETTTAPPSPAPAIDHTETMAGDPSTSFAVEGTMVLVGTGFSATASQNIVTFNGVSAAVSVDPADPTRRLLVTVPPGIPGAPVDPGDPDLEDVTVSARVGASAPDTTEVTVTAPVSDQPTIISVSTNAPFEGDEITIEGTNLAATAQVLIRDVEAPVVDRTPPTEIVVRVPDFEDILDEATVRSPLVIRVPGFDDTPFTEAFYVNGS